MSLLSISFHFICCSWSEWFNHCNSSVKYDTTTGYWQQRSVSLALKVAKVCVVVTARLFWLSGRAPTFTSPIGYMLTAPRTLRFSCQMKASKRTKSLSQAAGVKVGSDRAEVFMSEAEPVGRWAIRSSLCNFVEFMLPGNCDHWQCTLYVQVLYLKGNWLKALLLDSGCCFHSDDVTAFMIKSLSGSRGPTSAHWAFGGQSSKFFFCHFWIKAFIFCRHTTDLMLLFTTVLPPGCSNCCSNSCAGEVGLM